MWKEVAPEGNEDLGAEVQCFASQKRKREKGQGKHQCKQLFRSPLEMAVFLGVTEHSFTSYLFLSWQVARILRWSYVHLCPLVLCPLVPVAAPIKLICRSLEEQKTKITYETNSSEWRQKDLIKTGTDYSGYIWTDPNSSHRLALFWNYSLSGECTMKQCWKISWFAACTSLSQEGRKDFTSVNSMLINVGGHVSLHCQRSWPETSQRWTTERNKALWIEYSADHRLHYSEIEKLLLLKV